MSTDLVVQLGAKLDAFAADMNTAGDMADSAISRIEQSFASLNPDFGGFAALGAAATGAAGAVTGLVAALISVNSQLASVADAARYLSTTTDQVQKLQYAASTVGIGNSDSLAGLQNAGKLLNDALVNENSLTKLLDANGVQYKNQAGQLITINQLLSAGADLIRNSNTPADKSVIAGMLGLAKDWVPLLDQGSAGLNKLEGAAQDAGSVIDSDIVERAADFDKKWKNSSESFSTYLRSALVDLVPLFDNLIEKGAKLLKNLPGRSDIQASSDAALKGLAEPTGVSDTRVIKIDTDNLHNAIQEFENSPAFSVSTWTALGAAFAASVKIQSPEEAAKTISGYAASQIVEPIYRYIHLKSR
ncbi:hypothetical protein IC762_30500 [Bradyrhizobium genosp. L]|uniref:hypothetical protein n=1 Tax=Bradyrhizobium genosp. L TaxID=83637 RepID=UPI0018A31025|nr:hypothetical protein [Bradyrhizobium genosp. L]QPF83939.1 hypothetical protein IC762_30500 [Bradyrhizobium genosp. L]